MTDIDYNAENAAMIATLRARTGDGPVYDVYDPCFNFPNDLLNLRTSWGFGLRWFSPLGPLRFEWGFPLKPLPYEEHSVFEFTIGNFF